MSEVVKHSVFDGWGMDLQGQFLHRDYHRARCERCGKPDRSGNGIETFSVGTLQKKLLCGDCQKWWKENVPYIDDPIPRNWWPAMGITEEEALRRWGDKVK